MNSDFEAVVTEEMALQATAAYQESKGGPLDWGKEAVAAALAHPSFQSQIRAYAAGIRAAVLAEVRAVVPPLYQAESRAGHAHVRAATQNQVRAEFLAALTTLEQQP